MIRHRGYAGGIWARTDFPIASRTTNSGRCYFYSQSCWIKSPLAPVADLVDARHKMRAFWLYQRLLISNTVGRRDGPRVGSHEKHPERWHTRVSGGEAARVSLSHPRVSARETCYDAKSCRLSKERESRLPIAFPSPVTPSALGQAKDHASRPEPESALFNSSLSRCWVLTGHDGAHLPGS